MRKGVSSYTLQLDIRKEKGPWAAPFSLARREGGGGKIHLDDLPAVLDENGGLVELRQVVLSLAFDGEGSVEAQTRNERRDVVRRIVNPADDLLPQAFLALIFSAIAVAIVKGANNEDPSFGGHGGSRSEEKIENIPPTASFATYFQIFADFCPEGRQRIEVEEGHERKKKQEQPVGANRPFSYGGRGGTKSQSQR